MSNFSSYQSYSYYDGNEEGYVPLWIVIVVNIVLIIVTVVGNLLVILSYIRDERIHQNPAYTIILNLSITDLLVGVFIFPFNTLWYINGVWAYGMISCKLWIILDYSLFSMSTLTVIFISLDRYWLLTKGLAYQNFQTSRRVVISLAVAWVTVILLYTFMAFIAPHLSEAETELDPDYCALEVVESGWFNIFEIVVWFLLPFTMLIVLNVNVFLKVREHSTGRMFSKSLKPENSNSTYHTDTEIEQVSSSSSLPSHGLARGGGEEPHQGTAAPKSISIGVEMTYHESAGSIAGNTHDNSVKSQARDVTLSVVAVNADTPVPDMKGGRINEAKREERQSRVNRGMSESRKYRKAAVMLGTLVTMFCVCCLPYFIYFTMVTVFCQECAVSDRTWEIVSYLQWCNSTINPFIYGFTNLLFRRNILELLCIDKLWKKP